MSRTSRPWRKCILSLLVHDPGQVEPGLSQLTVKQAPKLAKKSDEPTLKLANVFYFFEFVS